MAAGCANVAEPDVEKGKQVLPKLRVHALMHEEWLVRRPISRIRLEIPRSNFAAELVELFPRRGHEGKQRSEHSIHPRLNARERLRCPEFLPRRTNAAANELNLR